jgi:hypothetical protein
VDSQECFAAARPGIVADGGQSHSSVLFITSSSAELDLFTLLGVLNSSVFWTFVSSTMPTMGEGRYALRANQLKNFAIPDSICQASASRRELRDAVAALLSGDLARNARQDAIDSVDRIVAELYRVAVTSLITPPRRAFGRE